MAAVKKILLPVLTLVLLAGLFRFYNWQKLQYWSPDDEVQAATIRKIIFDHKPVLVTPNAEITVSFGPFFHYLTAGVYLVSGMDPIKALFVGSLVGVATALLLFLTGKELFGKWAGFLAAFLYAGSTLTSLYDRRWWPLTLDPFLITLSVLSIFQISKKKYHYFLPLAIAVSFSWHADPTLLVLAVSVVLCFWLLRLPKFRWEYLPGLIYIIFSALPQLFFFARHKEAIINPLSEMVGRATAGGTPARSFDWLLTNLSSLTTAPIRFLFLLPSSTIEDYLCHCQPASGSPVETVISLTILAAAVIGVVILRKKHQFLADRGASICLVFLAVFFISLLSFSLLMSKKLVTPYFLIAMPVIFLLVGYFLSLALEKGWKILVFALCTVFLAVNLWALVGSGLTFPLFDKKRAMDFVLNQTGGRPFSLFVTTDPEQLESVGGLLMLRNRFPANLDYFRDWDWIYQSYTFYTPEVGTTPMKKVTIFRNSPGASATAVFGKIGIMIKKLKP